jgi:hypothetical protein
MSTTLYRAYDADHRLLYVGITDKLVTERLLQHRAYWRVGWVEHVTAVHVRHYDDRAVAAAAESVAIRDEDPVFNLAGRPIERSDAWMVAYPDRHADDIIPADIEEHDRELDRERYQMLLALLHATPDRGGDSAA